MCLIPKFFMHAWQWGHSCPRVSSFCQAWPVCIITTPSMYWAVNLQPVSMEIVILLTYLDSVMDMCNTHSQCRGEPERVRMQDMEQSHGHDCHQNIYIWLRMAQPQATKYHTQFRHILWIYIRDLCLTDVILVLLAHVHLSCWWAFSLLHFTARMTQLHTCLYPEWRCVVRRSVSYWESFSLPLASDEDAEELKRAVLAKVGMVTDVVYSIGQFWQKGPILDQSLEEYRKVCARFE